MGVHANPSTSTDDITCLLVSWSDGDQQALERLIPLIYGNLRRIAASFLRRERLDHTLETANLVNEAYLLMVDQDKIRWKDRAHFFAIAGQTMRRVLVDHARRRDSAKRGGGVEKISLTSVDDLPRAIEPDFLDLDQALNRLAKHDQETARLVELRYFGGLSKNEAAEVLGISSATVVRRWRLARAWLRSYLEDGEDHGG